MRWLVLFCVLAESVQAAQNAAAYDAKELLLNVRKKVMETVDRLPKYLCTETVDRSVFCQKEN